MARSYKKTPIMGHCGGSEKEDKKIWHSRQRAAMRDALAHESEVLPETKDVSDPWGMTKDGKSYQREDGWRSTHAKTQDNFFDNLERRKKFRQRREGR